MSMPPIFSRPLSGLARPAMVRRVVVLPTELGPNRTKKLPSATSNERLRNAIVWPKALEIPQRRSAGLRPSAIAIPPAGPERRLAQTCASVAFSSLHSCRPLETSSAQKASFLPSPVETPYACMTQEVRGHENHQGTSDLSRAVRHRHAALQHARRHRRVGGGAWLCRGPDPELGQPPVRSPPRRRQQVLL